ncbi:MAG: hypothetical protein HPY59_03905 [Anaerolineae bacterium]|nr:hypothetical protein [Anaerolineae bacterium]
MLGSARKFLFVFAMLAIYGGALSACSNQPVVSNPSASIPLPDAGVVPVSAETSRDTDISISPQPERQAPANPEVVSSSVSDDPGQETIIDASAEEPDSTALQSFINKVTNGEAGVIRGIYAANIFALRVLQQPPDDPAFVSSIEGTVTQFSQAAQMNIIGLLAHNFASGRHFFNLNPADRIHVIYGDGSTKEYAVTAIFRYQALQPNNPSSNFVNLETGETLTATQVFIEMYSGEHHLTLQTCIEQDGIDSWGRLFIIAQPVTGTSMASVQ